MTEFVLKQCSKMHQMVSLTHRNPKIFPVRVVLTPLTKYVVPPPKKNSHHSGNVPDGRSRIVCGCTHIKMGHLVKP